VLFCDIVNSTPLAERLGEEWVHRLLNRFFELALAEVHRYEGNSDPDDEEVVYAIESKHGQKGILVDALGITTLLE